MMCLAAFVILNCVTVNRRQSKDITFIRDLLSQVV
jgi:hypothetical protein